MNRNMKHSIWLIVCKCKISQLLLLQEFVLQDARFLKLEKVSKGILWQSWFTIPFGCSVSCYVFVPAFWEDLPVTDENGTAVNFEIIPAPVDPYSNCLVPGTCGSPNVTGVDWWNYKLSFVDLRITFPGEVASTWILYVLHLSLPAHRQSQIPL